MSTAVVYATGTSSVAVNGSPIVIRYGEHWPAGDPVVLAHPGLFSTDPRYGLNTSDPANYADPPAELPPLEQATAGPGERRATRRSA